MKRIKSIIILLLVLSLSSCEKEGFEEPLLAPTPQPFKANHSKAAAIQAIIDEYTQKGVAGIVVALKDKEGVWEGTSGFAKIEGNQKLTPGYVHTGGSITKTYTATAILKLQELNLIALDKPISNYLPTGVAGKITNADAITVRMLLNHTSGIPDYIENLNFKLHWFNDLRKPWTAEDAMAYAYHKPLLFKPGNQFSYSNSNYILLSLMIAHVTGKAEGEWLADNILNPLQLDRTYYKTQPGYLAQLPMPNYYLDRYGDGRLQNITAGAKTEIYSELGDGGLVATGLDFVSFMDALVHGKIISEASYNQMKTPAYNDYGLGIDIFTFKEKPAYGHSGAIIGGSALLLYFEEAETTLFIGSNVDGDLVPGKTFFLYHEMKNKISELIATNA
jgi:D-alanyl-D-alanine carboxypeptidase